MSFWKKALKIISIVFASLLVLAGIAVLTLYIFLKYHDLNMLKPHIESMVKDVTGQELIIKGDIKVKYSTYPTLVLNKVQLQDVLTVNHVEVEVKLRELLFHKVDVKRISLEKVRLHLATDKQDNNNWDFLYNLPDKLAKYNQQSDSGKYEMLPIDQLFLKNIDIAYYDGHTGQIYELDFKHINFEIDNPNNAIHLAAQGNYQDNILSMKARAKDHDNVDRAHMPLIIDAQGFVGKTKTHITGYIAQPSENKWLDLKINFKANNSRDIAELLKLNLPDANPVNLLVNILAEGDKFHLHEIDGQLADLKITGRGRVDVMRKNKWYADLHFTAPDNKLFNQLLGIPLSYAKNLDVKLTVSTADTRYRFEKIDGKMGSVALKGDGKINLPIRSAKWLDANLHFKAPSIGEAARLMQIKLKHKALKKIGPVDIKGHVTMGNNIINLKGVDATLGNFKASGDLIYQPDKKNEVVKAKIKLSMPNNKLINQVFDLPFGIISPLSINADFTKLKNGFLFRNLDGKLGSTRINLKGRVEKANKSKWLNMSIRARGKTQKDLNKFFGWKIRRLHNFDIRTKVSARGQVYQFKNIRGKVQHGTVSGSVKLNRKKNASTIRANIRARAYDVGGLIRQLRINPYFRGGNVEAKINASSILSSQKSFLRHLTGNIFISVTNLSYLKKSKTESGKKLKEALGGSPREKVTLHCLVTDMRFRNGYAHIKTMVFDSPKATVLGDGNVNIRQMTMDVSLNPNLKDAGIGSLINYARLKGPINNPQTSVTIKPQGVIKTIFGIVTLGIGFIPLIGTEQEKDAAQFKNICIRAARGEVDVKEYTGN